MLARMADGKGLTAMRLSLPFRIAFALAASPLAASCVHSLPAKTADQPGHVFELRLEQTTADQAGDTSGSSSSRQTLIETVIDVRNDGVVLEFDLPPSVPEKDRLRDWQFPALVFKRDDGSLELINAEESEQRRDNWLERGGIDRENCGRWIFTWTAIKIECDPYTILDTLSLFDLRLNNIQEGAFLSEIGTLGPAQLREIPTDRAGRTFRAEFQIDPAAVKSERAASDVIVSQISGDEPVTLDAALLARSSEKISGTRVVDIELGDGGQVVRRQRRTLVVIEPIDGSVETSETLESVSRESIAKEMAQSLGQ